MKNKKNYFLILIAIGMALLALAVVLIAKRNSAKDENIVTRYEWIQMLGEECGVTDYSNESPYFKDVIEDDPYFPYVQAATEWKMIEAKSSFKGEKPASGEFIALTAIKTIGENKLKLSIGTEDELSDDRYIELAEEYGLITREKLKNKFTKEECKAVLENLNNLHFGEFWKHDYSEVVYKTDVKQLSQDEVLKADIDGTFIEVPKEKLLSYKVGDILVYEQKNTKIKIAREITQINEDGTLALKPAELEQVVDSLLVSDVTDVTFDDIINYYKLEENTDIASNLQKQQMDMDVIQTSFFAGKAESEGFKISLFTEGENENRHLKARITDNGTGVSYTLPIESYQVEKNENYSAEINIDQLCIGGQVCYSAIDGLQYAEAAVDSHTTINAKLKGGVEKKIPLFKTPVALGNGLIGVKIEVYLLISAEGSISVEAEIPIEVAVSFEQGKGLKKHGCEMSFEEPTLVANCEASTKLRIEPIFVALGCLDVMDTEADIGVSAEANVMVHENIQTCADLSIAFPVFNVAVGADDDIDTLISNLGLSGEWEIITPDNAPIKWGMHYERLSDGTEQIVDECTYGKEKKEEATKQIREKINDEVKEADIATLTKLGTYELPIDLLLSGPFEDVGDHYVVKGNLSVGWYVICSDFMDLKEGDHFTTFDREFVRGSMVQTEEFPKGLYEVYCLEDGVTYYVPTETSYDFGSRFRADYYPICDSSIRDYYVYGMGFMSSNLGEYEFVVPKDAYITSTMEIDDHDVMIVGEMLQDDTKFSYFERRRLMNRCGHTAEECYKNHILLDDYIDITNGVTSFGDNGLDSYPIFCYAIFDESGMIDTLIWSSYA